MATHRVDQSSWDVLLRCLTAALHNDWWTLELEWSVGIERHSSDLQISCGWLLGHVIGEYSDTHARGASLGPAAVADLAELAWHFSKHWYHIPETELEKSLRAVIITKDYTALGQYDGAHLLLVVAALLYEGLINPDVVEYSRTTMVLAGL